MTVIKMNKPMICSICGGEIDVQPHGWDRGHNAQPINDGRCCTSCNTTEVIPERMARLYFKSRKETD